MNLWLLIGLVFFMPGLTKAETEISAPETGIERQETTSDQEWEAKGIIPRGGLTVSTQPITPIALLPERNPHDQAVEELALAQELWKKGKPEAASDVALQAYDDFMSLNLSRRDKKKRQQLHVERRQAATVYIDSSIAYIQEYVKKHENTKLATEEGHARLGDLRDVATNYPELMKKLHDTQAAYAAGPAAAVESSATVRLSTAVAPSTTTTK